MPSRAPRPFDGRGARDSDASDGFRREPSLPGERFEDDRVEAERAQERKSWPPLAQAEAAADWERRAAEEDDFAPSDASPHWLDSDEDDAPGKADASLESVASALHQGLEGSGQAPNRQEVGGAGQAPSRQEDELPGLGKDLPTGVYAPGGQTPLPPLLADGQASELEQAEARRLRQTAVVSVSERQAVLAQVEDLERRARSEQEEADSVVALRPEEEDGLEQGDGREQPDHEELVRLRALIEEHEQALERQQRELERVGRRATRLEQELDQANIELDDRKRRQSEIDRQLSSIEELSQQNEELSAQLERLKEENAGLQERAREALEQSVSSEELTKVRERAEELEASLEQERRRGSKLQTRLDTALDDLDELKRRSAGRDFDSVAQRAEALSAETAELQQALQAERSRAEQLEEERERERARAEQLQQAVDGERSRADELRARLDAERERSDEYRERAETESAKLTRLRTELDELRDALAEAKAESQATTELAENIAALNIERERLLAKLDLLRENADESNERLRDLEAQLDEAHQRLAESERRLSEPSNPSGAGGASEVQLSWVLRDHASRWLDRFAVLDAQVDKLYANVRTEPIEDGLVQLDEAASDEFHSMREVLALCMREASRLLAESDEEER
ncbi:MAG: hypothetical protein RBU37_12330 [Myxococcota bacterium]|nr:hypothetical protein [Myxococcota bacterium]